MTAAAGEDPRPPIAAKRPVTTVLHGRTRTDDYAWLRDRDDADVVAYLEAENAYTKSKLERTIALRDRLFEEFRSRVEETDSTTPIPEGPYAYYSRTVEGLSYDINCRRPLAPEAPEEVVLDENVLADGHEYFAVGAYTTSPDHRLLAYSTDTQGDEVYTLRVRDLGSGADLMDEMAGTFGDVAWADNETFFYTTMDEARRPYRVWRHRVGTVQTDDALVYEEADDAFHLFVGRLRSGAFVAIHIGSVTTTEVRFVDATTPDHEFRVLEERRHGIEYWIDHSGERFYITTNDGATNFRCMSAPVSSPGRQNWVEVLPSDPDVKLEVAQAFATHLVLWERCGGGTRLRVVPLDGGDPVPIGQDEPVHFTTPVGNRNFHTREVMFGYTSLTTPWSVYVLDLDTDERRLVKREAVLGGHDPDLYVSERLWAVAPDGTKVPMSVVRHRDTPLDGSAPGLMYAYGAYGVSTDPFFSRFVLSLLDRGVVYVLAHPRGGGELGRPWYDAGKLEHKPNTFDDVVACAEHLTTHGYVARDSLALRGVSAGGLLVGAVLNRRPDLFRVAVAEVPFVDCVNTLLDATLPLTVMEWEEWGDPRDAAAYETISSYAPYDNVRDAPYPRLLVTAGLHDPRVGFWEPAKWVARMRTIRSDDNELLVRTDMGTGHGGPSGRYDAWREEADLYAFILDGLGLNAAPGSRGEVATGN